MAAELWLLGVGLGATTAGAALNVGWGLTLAGLALCCIALVLQNRRLP